MKTDIKYGYIAGEDRFFFIQPCLDVYDRNVVACHIGFRCESKNVIRKLQAALFKRLLFEIKRKTSDSFRQCPQFISHRFEASCENLEWNITAFLN
ncbi:hypothetical protein [Paenibacillus polymyxa]|uniref:hypothetical protein n=1 Tax=Paenibacillus polymyxa TaxID=1406 RepID=UPI00237864EB|nr:hypothetical protein [Paenibacillus polymyxa]WDM20590.1 hypothetical protein J4I02_16285 [Paenibacillus polymyxa]